MANEKTKQHVAAIAHALAYSLPFWPLLPSIGAWLVIVITHELIDRYRLARYVVWAKNRLFAPPHEMKLAPSGWPLVTATGYPEDRPAWLAVWLLIIADNCCHILINGLALKYL